VSVFVTSSYISLYPLEYTRVGAAAGYVKTEPPPSPRRSARLPTAPTSASPLHGSTSQRWRRLAASRQSRLTPGPSTCAPRRCWRCGVSRPSTANTPGARSGKRSTTSRRNCRASESNTTWRRRRTRHRTGPRRRLAGPHPLATGAAEPRNRTGSALAVRLRPGRQPRCCCACFGFQYRRGLDADARNPR